MKKQNGLIKRTYKKLFAIIRRNFLSIVKYVTSGLLSILVDYCVLYFMTEFVGFFYLISVSISYLAAFAANFSLNKYWTFKKKKNTGKQLLKYGLLAGFNYLITITLMYSLTSVLGIHYLISRGMVIALVACWNFLLYKTVIYK